MEDLSTDQWRFHLLVDSIVDYAIVMLDPDGTIATWNLGAQRQLGYAEGEVIGHHVRMFYTDDDRRAGLPEEMLRHAAEHDRIERHVVRVRKDGSTYPCDLVLNCVRDKDGSLDGYASISRDVTGWHIAAEERVELIEQLHRAQRIESLGRLAGGIAHDFNNTLGAIANYAHLVETTLAEAVAEAPAGSDLAQAIDDIGQIQQAVRKAAELTSRLLVLGRKQVAKPEVTNLNVVVGDLTKLWRRTLGEQLDLHIDLESDLWNVSVDPTGIEQAILNLVINAKDAMPEGGTLTVRTSNVAADAYEGWDPLLEAVPHVCVEVTDTGHGMPREVLDRAFDPFFTTKPTHEGSGLGLAVVYGIVTKAGGQVYLYSEGGVGTTAKLLLPAVEAAARPRQSQEARVSPQGDGEVILLVEDAAGIRETLQRILELSGYRVLVAATPTEALDHAGARGDTIDLLLSDMVLPEMSGYELSQLLSRRLPGLRTVFMSGYAAGSSPGSVRGQVLVKPFGEHELLQRLHTALGRQG